MLTWHVHGNYLWYLTQTPHDFYVPFLADRRHPYGGRAGTFPWPPTLHEIAAEEVRARPFDCILFQSRANVLDAAWLLSPAQHTLPRIYLEHDPPLEHPFAQRHFVDDPDVVVVHVTDWNAAMWHTGRSPVRVIEHGVVVDERVQCTGELARGVCAINHLRRRARRMGADMLMRARERVPIDLVGMDARSLGGIGEIDPPALARFQARYRFAFSPIRQTSMALALIEAMSIGLPVVGFASGELAAVVHNGESGYVDTSLSRVIGAAEHLVQDRAEARRLGDGARRLARERYDIRRFARDWSALLEEVAA